MAKRSVLGRSVGFYSELVVGDEKEEEVGCLEVGEGDMEEGVFVVERVVERRRKRYNTTSGCYCSCIFI